MKHARVIVPVLSILVLAVPAMAASVAGGAGSPPTFVPKTGTYTGTMTSPAGSGEIGGQVTKEGKKYIVRVLVSTVQTCADGTRYPAGVAIPSTLKGKSFSATESGLESRSGGTATYKISGRFTTEKAFTGSASKEVTAGPQLPAAGACSTGTVKFSLKFKSSAPLH